MRYNRVGIKFALLFPSADVKSLCTMTACGLEIVEPCLPYSLSVWYRGSKTDPASCLLKVATVQMAFSWSTFHELELYVLDCFYILKCGFSRPQRCSSSLWISQTDASLLEQNLSFSYTAVMLLLLCNALALQLTYFKYIHRYRQLSL